MMKPLAYDLTHLVSRLMVPSPSGIDRVDLAFARHFAMQNERQILGLHLSLVKPRLMKSQNIGELVDLHDQTWQKKSSYGDDLALRRILNWLAAPPSRPDHEVALPPMMDAWQTLDRRWRKARLRFIKQGAQELPQGALYLNVAQHVLDLPRFYQWLDERPDLKKIFFLHDLLPLHMSEYFRSGYRAMFDGVIDLMTRHANALITTTEAVREDVIADLKRRGRPAIPIFVAPLPSPLGDERAPFDETIHQHDYFIATGTIEPRKNHLLLLQVWRELVERARAKGAEAPRLVIIGKRGWENEQVIDLLERCQQIGGHVIEASNLSSAGLCYLLRNARAALCPSFGEGYGLPVVEALSLGTPVIASDIKVFREVSQNCARFISPIDGKGWLEAIEEMSAQTSAAQEQWRAKATSFQAPQWADYFGKIEAFLQSL